MTARNRKNEFRPKFSVGMNAHARQLVERVRQREQGFTLDDAVRRGQSFAEDVIWKIYRCSAGPEARLCTIMQVMQALANAVPENYKVANWDDSGSWVLTTEGCEWLPKAKPDKLIALDSKLPKSFFAKSRSKKDASK